MFVGVPDSKLKHIDGIIASDEGEAVAIAAGYYLATGKPATVFLSADGFCNALNPITSLIIPYGIPVKWIISTGRQEPQHRVMSDTVDKLLELYDKGTSDRTVVR